MLGSCVEPVPQKARGNRISGENLPLPKPLRITVIANPVSGRVTAAVLDRIRAQLSESGCQVQACTTEYSGHATELAAEVRDQVDMVAVAGGDGTVNEVVNGLAGSTVPLGVIPLGTANVLAKELGVARSVAAAIAALKSGVSKPVNLGCMDGRYFLLMAGAGFDAEVVHSLNSGLKNRTGRVAYVWSGLRVLFCTSFADRVRVESEQGHCLQGTGVIVHNAQYYAGPWRASPKASIQEHHFHVTVFHAHTRRATIGTMIALFQGEGRHLNRDDVSEVKARTLRLVPLTESAPVPIQLDGDPAGCLASKIWGWPAGLHLVYPPEEPGQE